MDMQERLRYLKKTFNTIAEGYDGQPMHFFVHSAQQLASFLNLHGNERVLDVATGTGHVALNLAEELPGGFVTGIDISTAMLAQAMRKSAAAGIKNVNFLEMDMQSLQFPNDHFDLVISNFGIFFVEDMAGQLSHLIEKVKPGGQVLITTFGETSFSPYIDLFRSRMEKFGVSIPPVTWQRVATPEQSRLLFKDCKLKKIKCAYKDIGYFLRDVNDWLYILYNGGFRGLIDQLSTSDRKNFDEIHAKEIRKFISKDGLWLELSVIYTIGVKPS